MKQSADVSGAQTVNWPEYRTWSDEVIIKATEGVGFTDPTYPSNRQESAQNGVLSNFYHFGRPDLNNTPEQEADYCASVIGNIEPDQRIFLDIERGKLEAAWSLAWLIRASIHYPGQVGVYASLDYIQNNLQLASLENYHLWIADWKLPPPPPPPWPWSSLWGWQFTDVGAVPGVSGVVDVSFIYEEADMLYSENSKDFSSYFVSGGTTWIAKNNMPIIGDNLKAFKTMSVDGQTLPVIGLPLSAESYITYNGQKISVQFFERAIMAYDPSHAIDSQPGFTNSYLLKYDQALSIPEIATLDPRLQLPTVTVDKIPDAIIADIKQLVKDAGL